MEKDKGAEIIQKEEKTAGEEKQTAVRGMANREAEKKRKAENPRSAGSCLTGIPGLLLLFAGFVSSGYIGAGTVSIFFLIFFLVCSASALWCRGVCRHVFVEIEAPVDACYAGQKFVLRMQVRNRSFFPLVWLDLMIPLGARERIKRSDDANVSWYYFPGQEKPQTGLRQRFIWLLWHQEIIWNEELTALRRGCLYLSRINLQAGDGFGLSVCDVWRNLEKPLCVYIYPALVPVRSERFLQVTQEAVVRSKGCTEDITLLKSSRSYNPGDPAKRINWRLLASSGKMQVNLYETVQPGCVAFVLDLESFRKVVEYDDARTPREIYVKNGDLENMISAVASCMKKLTESRIPVALLLPAFGNSQSVVCLPGEEDMGFRSCMEAFSLVDYRGEDAAVADEDLWRISRIASSLYFCVCTDQKNRLEEQAMCLGSGRIVFLAGRRDGGNFGRFSCLYLDEIASVSEREGSGIERIS